MAVGIPHQDSNVLGLALTLAFVAGHQKPAEAPLPGPGPASPEVPAAPAPTEDGPVRLGRFIDLRVDDPAAPLAPAEAFTAPGFHHSSSHEPSFGLGEKTVWARFSTRPPPDGERWLLRAPFPRPLDIRLYAKDDAGGVRLVATDGLERAAARGLLAQEIVLPLDPTAREHALRVVARPARLHLELWSAAGLERARRIEMLLAGIYYGIFAGLFLYNLFLGVSLRDGVHVLYCAFLVCMAMHIVVRDGLTPPWGPAFIFKHGGGMAITSVVMLVFARRFLRLAPQGASPGHPRVDAMLRAVTAVSAALFLAALVGQDVAAPSAATAAASIIVVVGAAAVVAGGGDRPALWFLLGWSVLIASSAWSLALAFGVADGNLLTRHGMKIGSAVEMVLLSLALASRVHVLRSEKERAELELVRARTAAQAELAGRLLEAQESERERFARELHDGLGHALLVLKEKLRGAVRAGKAIEPGEAARLGEEAQSCIDDARAIARNLVPPTLARLGLVEALRATAGDLAASTGVDVRVDARGLTASLAARLDARLEGRAIHVFRIAQEAMANALRHGAASSVTMTVAGEKLALLLAVDDDGRGFDPATVARGLGLLDMEQRARIVGAVLDISSVPGQGTRVSCRVPLSAEPREAAPGQMPGQMPGHLRGDVRERIEGQMGGVG